MPCPVQNSHAITLYNVLSSLGKFSLVDHRALIDAVLLDDFAVMEHIELLRGVFACEQHDRFLAARMVRQESYTSSPTMTQ